MSATKPKRPEFPWLHKLNRDQHGLDEIGADNILRNAEDYIASLEARLRVAEPVVKAAQRLQDLTRLGPPYGKERATDIAEARRTLDQALATASGEGEDGEKKCERCNGFGRIYYSDGDNEEYDPCPDCSAEPPGVVLSEAEFAWLLTQIIHTQEAAEVVAATCELATARAVVADLKDARALLDREGADDLPRP